jgi:hypothetical protein
MDIEAGRLSAVGPTLTPSSMSASHTIHTRRPPCNLNILFVHVAHTTTTRHVFTKDMPQKTCVSSPHLASRNVPQKTCMRARHATKDMPILATPRRSTAPALRLYIHIIYIYIYTHTHTHTHTRTHVYVYICIYVRRDGMLQVMMYLQTSACSSAASSQRQSQRTRRRALLRLSSGSLKALFRLY